MKVKSFIAIIKCCNKELKIPVRGDNKKNIKEDIIKHLKDIKYYDNLKMTDIVLKERNMH